MTNNNKPSNTNTKANGSNFYLSLIAMLVLFTIGVGNNIKVNAEAYTNAYDVYITKSEIAASKCTTLIEWTREDLATAKESLIRTKANQ